MKQITNIFFYYLLFLFFIILSNFFNWLYKIAKFLYIIKLCTKMKEAMVDFIQKTNKNYKYWLFLEHRAVT